jgi:hypothetical protein
MKKLALATAAVLDLFLTVPRGRSSYGVADDDAGVRLPQAAY